MSEIELKSPVRLDDYLVGSPAFTATIRNQPIDVYVNVNGYFCAPYKGRRFTGHTWEALREDLMKATRLAQSRVNVPITIVHTNARHGGPSFEDAVIYGIHAGSGKAMVVVGKSRSQLDWPSSWRGAPGSWLRRLSDDEKAEWSRLRSAYIEADEAVDKFKEAHSFEDVKVFVQAEIAKDSGAGPE